jgi:hypothetical protein
VEIGGPGARRALRGRGRRDGGPGRGGERDLRRAGKRRLHPAGFGRRHARDGAGLPGHDPARGARRHRDEGLAGAVRVDGRAAATAGRRVRHGGGAGGAWTGPGARPVVSFHFGTLGLGPQCAFSRQLAGAYQDEYEGDQIAAILRAGWAVAATDDVGYLTGQHAHLHGRPQRGHAMLDAARAAFRLPGSGLSSGRQGRRLGLLAGRGGVAVVGAAGRRVRSRTVTWPGPRPAASPPTCGRSRRPPTAARSPGSP